VSYAEEFDSELDSDPDDAKKKSKANMAVALMDSTEDLDDEVERVLGHRWVISHSFCAFVPHGIGPLIEQLKAVLLFCSPCY
jgi:hypothetical protein